MRSIHWTRFISITNDSGKSHGYHIQTVRMRRTSSWCSICLNSGQNGRCFSIIETSQVLPDYCEKDNLRKCYWDLDWRMYRIGMAYLCIHSKVYSCLKTWDYIKLAGGKQNLNPMWNWWNLWISETQHHFLTTHIWRVLDVIAKANKCIVDEYRKMCKSRISVGESRPHILWSVKTLTRAVTKWTRACDKRLARLISVGNTVQPCRLGLFQDSDFCWWLWRLKIDLRWENFVYSWESNIRSHKLDV